VNFSEELATRLARIRHKIEISAATNGRSANDITILAACKNQPVAKIEQVLLQGITNIGENKVQELIKKYQYLGSKASWHFIGHLQRNKVSKIIKFVNLIHSVDSFSLAKEINKRAGLINKSQELLLEVNVSGESSKFGISLEDLEDVAKEVFTLNNVKVVGLMTMAPLTDNAEEVRPIFRQLARSFYYLGKKYSNHFLPRWLSMGMTNDYQVAIEEGANLIRLGRAIFG
jgi:hypothetical protein